MIVALKPYPVMKDPGIAWLGEVPEHWGYNFSNNTKAMFPIN